VTGLLPDAVREALAHGSPFGGGQTFGVVALVLLIALLVERELLAFNGRSLRSGLLSVFVPPLLAVFIISTIARVVALLP
jgi:hypothetical protein